MQRSVVATHPTEEMCHALNVRTITLSERITEVLTAEQTLTKAFSTDQLVRVRSPHHLRPIHGAFAHTVHGRSVPRDQTVGRHLLRTTAVAMQASTPAAVCPSPRRAHHTWSTLPGLTLAKDTETVGPSRATLIRPPALSNTPTPPR